MSSVPLVSVSVAGLEALGVDDDVCRAAILTGWFLVIAVLIAHRFWDYWVTMSLTRLVARPRPWMQLTS